MELAHREQVRGVSDFWEDVSIFRIWQEKSGQHKIYVI